MGNIIASIGLLGSHNLFLAYFIIYIAIIFLGNISAFASFWIVFQGYFGPWGVPFLLIAIYAGNVSGDLLWYTMGRTLQETKFGNWIRKHTPGYEKAAAAVERNGRGLMMVSKFIVASAFPVMFSVGWTKMPFKKFVRTSLLSALLWLPVLIGLSYAVVSGLSPLHAVAIIRDFEWLFFVGLGLFIILDYLLAWVVNKLLNRPLNRKNKEEDV